MRILVTGGAGFIGSNFVRHALQRWSECRVVVLDKLTYAGNLANLASVRDDSRLSFMYGDICSPESVRAAMADCQWIVNFAAETHVDRSIIDSGAFVQTDVEGTRILLEAARKTAVSRYVQVSTDEVYGHVPAPARTAEDAPLRPRSPYSASKAAGDLMVQAYYTTYGLPTFITRGANTYGPYQYPEKLISLFVTNALDCQPLPLYGDGMQMRDWLYVEDHCAGVASVLERGAPGAVYNIGTARERPNRDIVDRIVALTACDPSLVQHVADRPGHDARYALDIDRIESLGWYPATDLESGLESTVEWYRRHRDWWEPLKRDSGFRAYYQTQYRHSLAESGA